MGDYGADTLRDTIETNWSLTGRLDKTESATMKEVVMFFARPQIAGNEVTKAVEVVKLNTDTKEGIVAHEKFKEIRDKYEITCRYRTLSTDETGFNEAEADVEDMCEEVLRIIQTIYNPLTATGTYFVSSIEWQPNDDTNTDQPELKRTMILTLTQIQSGLTTVFKGYGGVLVFDTANSEGDNKPGANYTYTEAYDVQAEEGFDQIKENITSNPLGAGIPAFFRGSFRGFFQCNIYAKKADIGAQTNQLNTIYKTLANGEIPTIVFLHTVSDTEAVPATLQESIAFKPTLFKRLYDKENLVVFLLRGEITKPTTFTIA